MYILAALIVGLAGLAGVALAVIGLSGAWLTILVAIGVQLWRPETFSWWTIGAAAAIALLAEIAEFVASGVGARKLGGSKRAAAMAIIGALAGAIVGTFALPAPILGSIVGGIIGAGVMALLAERTKHGRTWGQSWRVGRGAAVGKAVSMVVKTGFTVVVGVLLFIAAVL